MTSVLSHFDAGASNAASVSSLSRTNSCHFVHQVNESFVSCRHVSTFAVELAAGCYDVLSVCHVYVVLHSARDEQVNLNVEVLTYAPRLLAGNELSFWELFCVRSADVLARSSQFEQDMQPFHQC